MRLQTERHKEWTDRDRKKKEMDDKTVNRRTSGLMRERLLKATCRPLVSPASEYLSMTHLRERKRERENLKDIKCLSS